MADALPLLTATRVAHFLRRGGHKAVAIHSRRARGHAGSIFIAGYKCTQAKSGDRGSVRRQPFGPIMVHAYVPSQVGLDAYRKHYQLCLDLLAAYEKTLRAQGCVVRFHNDSFGMHLEVSL